MDHDYKPIAFHDDDAVESSYYPRRDELLYIGIVARREPSGDGTSTTIVYTKRFTTVNGEEDLDLVTDALLGPGGRRLLVEKLVQRMMLHAYAQGWRRAPDYDRFDNSLTYAFVRARTRAVGSLALKRAPKPANSSAASKSP